ncbi:MAG: hypothetical protein U9N34_10250 [Candidatus Cloacimonadota bacterium]|nr:hypothetical protein [Candidatus Cloacimonadota bacterium]
MNQMEFLLNKKDIENAKTVKKLEEYIRRYEAKLSSYGSEISENIFMLFTFALYRFAEKTDRVLPDFIYKKEMGACQLIISIHFNAKSDHTLTYDKFIELFQYSTAVYMPREYGDDYLRKDSILNSFDQFIQNKPQPYDIQHEYRLSSFHNTALLSSKVHSIYRKYAMIEQMNQQRGYSSKSTVLTAELKNLRSLLDRMPKKDVNFDYIVSELESYTKVIRKMRKEFCDE